MKFSKWRRSKTVETEFRNALLKLTKIFNKIANSSGEDQERYVRSMNNFQNSVAYEKFINSAVRRMVTSLSKENGKTWRDAAKKNTKGKFLYNLLMREINSGLKTTINDQIIENIGLIRTLPSDVATKTVNDIVEQAQRGRRASSIAKDIKKYTDKHARASARLIARTEVSKTSTALTRARSRDLNINWYVWRTALDGDRVRESHRIMEDVLVNWNVPPSPEILVGEKSVGRYHAGNIFNCRCYAEPLLEIDDVAWPHKVYYNERIVMMHKKDFEKML